MEYGDVKMLTFKNVTFRYPEDSEAMMTNLSFHVDRGELCIADRCQWLR